MMAAQVITFVLLAVTFGKALQAEQSGLDNWDSILAKRVVFAVDTSASMLLDDVNIKLRQAISVWTKYLSPQNTSISITQLKLKDDLTVENVAGATLANILPEDDFYGGTCLFCGLKEAARVLNDASAQDLVVLLMEERAEDAPHDTPAFALQSVQPRFRIFTVALSEKADPELELLASSTHGASDFIKEPTFARFVQTFSMLPVAKSYSVIANQECAEDAADCPVEFELDESVPQSSLLIFLCPQTSRQFSSVQLEYDLLNVDLDEGDSVEPLEHKFDDDSGCWVYQKDNPNSGIWQLKVNSVNDSFSVAAILQNAAYHQLHCSTYQLGENTYIKASLDPPIENIERLVIAAFIESGDEKFDGIPLDLNGSGEFSSCLKPTGRTGRHSLECRAARSGVALLTSQAHSFTIDEWPSDRDYCPLEVQVAPVEVTTSAENVTSEAKEETNDETTQPLNATKTLMPEEDEEKDPIISSDSAQMIIVVVGGIIIAEMVFIFVRCRNKVKDRERQRSLIPYAVDPKDNPNLKYQKVGKDDVEEDLS